MSVIVVEHYYIFLKLLENYVVGLIIIEMIIRFENKNQVLFLFILLLAFKLPIMRFTNEIDITSDSLHIRIVTKNKLSKINAYSKCSEIYLFCS